MAAELVFKDEAAAEYDRAFAHVTAHFMPFLLRAAHVAPGMHVLDIATSPRLHSTVSKLESANESACPSSTATEAFGALPRRSRAFSAMAGETSAAMTRPLGPTAASAASAESPVP